jgi:hypothetical protein
MSDNPKSESAWKSYEAAERKVVSANGAIAEAQARANDVARRVKLSDPPSATDAAQANLARATEAYQQAVRDAQQAGANAMNVDVAELSKPLQR